MKETMNNIQLPKFIRIRNNIFNIEQIRNIFYINKSLKLVVKFIDNDDYFEINDIYLLDFIEISNQLTKIYITTK